MFAYWLETLLAVAFIAVLIFPVFSSDKGRRSLLLALRSLWLHKLRAFLSVLGIIIGTGSVIGSAVARDLYPFSNPVGETIRIGTTYGYFYRIVGVIKDRMPTGGTGGSQAAEDYNHDVYIPLETTRARFGDMITTRQAGSFQ